MGYYSIRPLEYTDSGWMYMPDFTPRKAEFGKMLSETANILEQEKQSVSSLSPEQKQAFQKQLHYGKGGMTLQEWDDFLADLVEYGVITNDERYYANGVFLEIPEGVIRGDPNARDADTEVFDQMWKGDPLKWLNQMDAYFLKNSFYGDMRCAYGKGFSGQRDAYVGVQKILKEILPEGANSYTYDFAADKMNPSQNARSRSVYANGENRIKAGSSLSVLSQQQLSTLQNALYENIKSSMLTGDNERNASGRAAVQRLYTILNEILW